MLTSQFQRIGIVCRRDTPQAFDPLSKIVHTLLEEGLQVFLDEDNLPELEGLPLLEQCEFASKADLGRLCHLVMVMGGDGTFLSVARKIAPFNVPIIGGHLNQRGHHVGRRPCDESRIGVDRHAVRLHLGTPRGGDRPAPRHPPRRGAARFPR